MKKIFIMFIVLGAFIIGSSASAAEFRTEERYELPEGETVEGDLYVFGGNAVVRGTVNGDLFVAGGNTRVTGKVNGSVNAAGGQVAITGETAGAIRAAGGDILVDGAVGKDLIVTGGNIELGGKSVVNGDTLISGGQVEIAGSTKNVKVNAGTLRLTNSAKVEGSLKYASENEATIASGATVTGDVSRTEIKRNEAKNAGRTFLGFGFIVSLVITVLLARLLTYLFPAKSQEIAVSWREHLWMNLLWGIVFLVVVPIVCVMLFITLFGIPLSTMLLFVYAVTLYVARLVAVVVFGSWLFFMLRKDQKFNLSWPAVLLGAVVLALVGYIPVLGWLVFAFIYLTALGALVSVVRSYISRSKNSTVVTA